MENKFKEHFEALQAKGAFEGVKFEDLTEEQSQELTFSYLGKLDEDIQAINQKSDEEKQELKSQVETLKQEKAAYEAKASAISQKLTEKMIEQAEKIGASDFGDAIKELQKVSKEIHEAHVAKERKEFSIKADVIRKAVTLTTSVQNTTLGQRDPRVAELAHRVVTAYEAISTKTRINENEGGKLIYVDIDPATSIRAAAAIAETGTVPESTIGFIERNRELKDIGDSLPYSKNFQYDYSRLMQYLDRFLRQNIALIEDEQIINGDGTGDNYTGIIASIPAYVPVAAGITDANIFDLAVRVSNDITTPEGSKYQPNLMFMNSDDIDSINYALKKDGENNYIPLEERMLRRGIRVVPNNSLQPDEAIIGDETYSEIIEDGLINIETGVRVNDDALKRIERILVFTRKNMLIRNEESTAWRYISSIQAALTTIAS